MGLLWFILIAAVVLSCYAAYDRFLWWRAKYDEAKDGVILIAKHMKLLRASINATDSANRKRLEGMFSSVQLADARIAYILGGARFLDEVSRVEASSLYDLPNEQPKEKEEKSDLYSKSIRDTREKYKSLDEDKIN